MVESVINMRHEALVGGIKEITWGTSERKGDVLSRTREVIERHGQPALESLYEKNKRDFPFDEDDQDILNVLYAARLCLRENLCSPSSKTNGVPEVGLDEVFQGYGEEERMQIALRLKPEIVFVRTCTPSMVEMSTNVDFFLEMGIIDAEEKRRFIREFRSS